MTDPTIENKKMWADALRSGKYKQSTGYLKVEDSFCCLGVMCDLENQTAWDGDRWLWIDDNVYTTRPPFEVNEKFGLSEDEVSALTTLNDSGLTFEQIAEVIQGNYFGYKNLYDLEGAVVRGEFY